MDNRHLIADEPSRFTAEALDRVLIHCVKIETSDITIQTGSAIFAEVHGQLFRVTTRELTNTEVGDILNTIYGANGTTQLFSGKDIDTHYEIRPNRVERFRFRVNGTGCQVSGHDGIQITLRTIPSTPPELQDMALEQDILEHMAPQQGTVIVTGATGSGKSTLLAAMIRHLAEEPEGHRKILTYESPIEFVYDGVHTPTSLVSQSEIPKHLPDFAAGVRNALRRKPRLILVGEARDPATVSAVIEASLTGHPVYSTLHSNGVADAVRRMIALFPAEERPGKALDILETLRLVIWQKLVQSTDGKRVALREFLAFNDEIRDALLQTDIDHLAGKTRALLQQHGQPMIVDAEKKYQAGLISQRDFNLLAQHAKVLDQMS